jgi:23S rRNA pseudouridine1911/1915/1917 synthase
MPQPVQNYVIPAGLAGQRLDYAVRELFSLSWGQARKWIETGKIFLDGVVVRDASLLVVAGVPCESRLNAPRIEKYVDPIPGWIVYEDQHVVVINKPPEISSVKFNRGTGPDRPDESCVQRAAP